MKFEIATPRIQAMSLSAIKGSGGSKIIPITEYFKIEVKKGSLSITATDSVNFLTVHVNGLEKSEDGVVLVKADPFHKLVSRTSKPIMKFDLKDDVLEISGNGKYKMDTLQGDTFPDCDFEKEDDYFSIQVDCQAFHRNLQVNQGAIAKEMFVPYFTGYNCGSSIVTTDGIKLCSNGLGIVTDKKFLLGPNLFDMIPALSPGPLMIEKSGGKLKLTTASKHGGVTIIGAEMDGIEDYPDIETLVNTEMPNKVTVNRSELVEALSRLALFVDPFKNFAVKLTFEDYGFLVSDHEGNNTEALQYLKDEREDEKVELSLNISLLLDLLNSTTLEEVVLEYSEGAPLKLVSNQVVQMLSLLNLAE